MADGLTSRIQCNSGILPNGAYYTLVQYTIDGLQYNLVLTSSSIQIQSSILSISPNMGSIGGGTQIIVQGSGFSPVLDQNVVMIQVINMYLVA